MVLVTSAWRDEWIAFNKCEAIMAWDSEVPWKLWPVRRFRQWAIPWKAVMKIVWTIFQCPIPLRSHTKSNQLKCPPNLRINVQFDSHVHYRQQFQIWSYKPVWQMWEPPQIYAFALCNSSRDNKVRVSHFSVLISDWLTIARKTRLAVIRQ